VRWAPLAKDACDLPPWQAAARRAEQPVSIGEPYDVRVQSADSATTTLELRTQGGRLVAAQAIRFVR